MRADGLRGKGIKRLQAFLAPPERTDDRGLPAGGAGKPAAARQLRHPGQHARLHQPTPAIQQDEYTQDAKPHFPRQDG
jgi:hypothetical protein